MTVNTCLCFFVYTRMLYFHFIHHELNPRVPSFAILLDCNKTRMSVRWQEERELLEFFFRKTDKRKTCEIRCVEKNRGCLNVSFFVWRKKGCFSSENSWRMWYVTQRASQDDRTPKQFTHPSAHPSYSHSFSHLYMLSTPRSINLQSIQFILVRVDFKLQSSCCH